ncbi:MAG: hypothetical protein U1E89_10150 [Burkholderiaceae bacterium]
MSRTYFSDRDLGKQFPSILADSGIAVERHKDFFAQDGSDEQWLEYCGKNARIGLTHNVRIRYVANELAAVRRFKVGLVVLMGHATTAGLARNFVRTVPRLEALLDTLTPPYIVEVYRPTPADILKDPSVPGRAELWFPRR